MLGRVLNIDIVDADASAADDPETGRSFEQLSVYVGGRADQSAHDRESSSPGSWEVKPSPKGTGGITR